MELTSAVRSVSYKSDMNKCNGNVGKSNDPESLAGNAKVTFFSFLVFVNSYLIILLIILINLI